METGLEGCLSIPGWVGDVPRHVSVTVKGQTPEGKEVRLKADHYFARVLQHEIDHLNGVLFTDRMRISRRCARSTRLWRRTRWRSWRFRGLVVNRVVIV